MQLSDESKRDILDFMLSLIFAISNKEYQRRVWINAEGPECDDFDDTVCNFLHEGDAIIEKYKEFGLTDTQFNLLQKFRDEFRSFSNKHDLPEEFIDTPEWERIMKMASTVLKAFNYQRKT